MTKLILPLAVVANMPKKGSKDVKWIGLAQDSDQLWCVSFEVLTLLLMKIQIFWDVTLCRLVNRYSHFGGASCICLQV